MKYDMAYTGKGKPLKEAMDAREVISHEPYQHACMHYGLTLAEAELIIAGFLARLRPAMQPVIMHTLGPPASGKSTFARGNVSAGWLYLDFDDVMEKISLYRRDFESLGAQKAFENWVNCAREIGYEILFRAIDLRANIFFDHSGARPDHVMLLRYMQGLGYRIKITRIDIGAELAAERAAKRARHLPPHFITERIKILNDLVPQYREFADEFVEYRATIDGNIPVTA